MACLDKPVEEKRKTVVVQREPRTKVLKWQCEVGDSWGGVGIQEV